MLVLWRFLFMMRWNNFLVEDHQFKPLQTSMISIRVAIIIIKVWITLLYKFGYLLFIYIYNSNNNNIYIDIILELTQEEVFQVKDNVEVILEDKMKNVPKPNNSPPSKKIKTGGHYYEIFKIALIKKIIINEYWIIIIIIISTFK